MTALGRYATIGLLIAIAAIGSTWPFLDDAARLSLAVAAAIALPIQIALFAVVSRTFGEPSRFLVGWSLGIGFRALVVAIVALGVNQVPALAPSVLVLSTIGYFFVLVLVEPLFLGKEVNMDLRLR